MSWVTVYDSAARGDATPIRTLHLRPRGLLRAISLGVDRAGYLYVGSGEDPRLGSGSIAVFDAGADGNVQPIRVLSGLGSNPSDPLVFAVDRRGHLYVANTRNRSERNTVRVFDPGADGDAAPCRVIAGPHTELQRPSGLALDRKDRLYVGNSEGSSTSPLNAVTMYEAWATGDATPSRTLAGGNKHDNMQWPHRLAFDSHDFLYVRSIGVLAVFAPGATGASEPARYIMRRVPGKQYATVHAPKLFALDRHDTLYAMSGDTVMVYPPGYSGSGPAVRHIAGPRSGVREVTDIALDNRGWLYLAERGPRLDSALIRVYAPGANGDVPPSRTITGPRTRLMLPTRIALDRSGRLYVANSLRPDDGGAIAVYAPAARGEDQPVRVLVGPATRLSEPTDIEFDSHGNMYVPNSGWVTRQVSVFRSQASGNEAPVRTIAGPRTLLRRPTALALSRGDTLYALDVNVPRGRCDSLATWGEATVTAYAPKASGDVEPLRSLVLAKGGKSPGRKYGLTLLRGVAVDTSGAVQVWHADGSVRYPPDAQGLTAPVHTMVRPTVPGAEASGVTVSDNGWVYETNAPSNTCP